MDSILLLRLPTGNAEYLVKKAGKLQISVSQTEMDAEIVFGDPVSSHVLQNSPAISSKIELLIPVLLFRYQSQNIFAKGSLTGLEVLDHGEFQLEISIVQELIPPLAFADKIYTDGIPEEAFGLMNFLKKHTFLYEAQGSEADVIMQFIEKKEQTENVDFTASFSNDGNVVGATDAIKIEDEAKAFARLFLSTAVQPPLSVAVFGYWGSGKSFFMNKVVEFADRLAADSKEQLQLPKTEQPQQIPYHDNVVQIPFNAWHYMETNLWACLVDQIFSSLNKALSGDSEESEDSKKRNALFESLTTAQELKEESEQKIIQLAKERDDLQAIFTGFQATYDIQTNHLNKIQTQDVWDVFKEKITAEVKKNGAVTKTEHNEAAQRFGFADVQGSFKEIHAQGVELKSVLGRGKALFASFAHLKGSTWIWLAGFLILLPLGVTVIAAVVEAKAKTGGNSFSINEFATSFGGILASISLWVKKGLTTGKAALDKLDEVRAEIEKVLSAKIEEHAGNISSQELAVKAIEQDLAFARAGYEEASTRVQEAERELLETSAVKRILDFVKQRATDQTYRQHLGLISTIRRDFEQLSDLMKQKTKEKNDKRLNQDLQEKLEDLPQVDRIILYIDDLDRCPKEKVVDVLQAIHLLLSFDLFVVVVAVDERWLSSSLTSKYKHLIDEKNATSEASSPNAASAYDYLEKIFQIPYWVKVMGKTAQDSLIDVLIPPKEVMQIQEESKTKPEDQDEEKIVTYAQVGNMQAGGPLSVLGYGGASYTPTKPEPLKIIEGLKLSQVEVDTIKSLNPVFAQSPRRSTRFVNCYRIIKASLGVSQEMFVGETGTKYEYRAVLFLLAIFVREPQLAGPLHEALGKEGNKNLSDLNLGTSFEKILEIKIDWPKKPNEKLLLEEMKELLPLVRRFSFGTAHQELN